MNVAKILSMFLILGTVLPVAECIADADKDKAAKPVVLEFYAARKEAKKGYMQGQYQMDESLYCGPKMDFTKHVVSSSCSRQPGDDAPYFVFIFLDVSGGEKLKELTKESLKKYVAIDVDGKSVGLANIEVVHDLVDFRGEQRGLLTFSVGQDVARGKSLAAAINTATGQTK